MDTTVAHRLFVALFLGFVIGIERGWRSQRISAGETAAGVRTFAFVGLFGGVAALLAEETQGLVLAAAFLALGAMVTTSYLVTSRSSEDYGATTEIALLLTFALGATAMRGFTTEAVAFAVVMVVFLGFKAELHSSLERLDRRELTATIQLLAIAVVALPLLPNRDMGPFDALNPRAIGLLVLLIAGISYVGYFSVRIFGPRAGILMTAVFGGLSSSTAVTVAFARMARGKSSSSLRLFGCGIVLAAATMAPRLLLEVAIVERALVPYLALPLGALMLVPLLAALFMSRNLSADHGPVELQLENPLDLKNALGYGLALAVLFVLVRVANEWLGDVGVYVLASVSGLADVDAVSISLARAAGQGLDARVAATGVMIAALVNTVSKAALAGIVAGRDLWRLCGAILLGAVAVAGLITIIVR